MKILKYTLAIIVILVVGFFSIGLIKPEISYDCETTVEKPLEECWAVSQDEEKMSEWMEGFQKIEQISGTPGTEGAVADVYFISEGEEMVIRETITEIVPNESISMVFTMDFMDMDYKLSMSSIDNKTKISSSTKVKGNGMLSKSIIAMTGSSFKSQEETNLGRLKNTIENN